MASQDHRGFSASPTSTVRAATVLLFLVIAISYFVTERAGDYWGDDFALYVHHAKNIASGISYTQTGYLFNPLTPDYSPAYYPPIFPLALSIVYSVRGLDWHALKVEQSFLLLASVIAIWLYFRRWLTAWLALLCAAMVAWNPEVYLFHDLLVAEPLFICLLFLSLERVDRIFEEPPSGHTFLDGLMLGVLFYLCFGCRSAGLVVLPGAWAFSVLRHRRVPLVLAIATAIGLAGYFIQKVVLGPDLYLAQFHPTLPVIFANLYTYLSFSQAPFNAGLGLPVTHAVAGMAWVLAGLGIFKEIRQRTLGGRSVEWFALPYLLLILAWPAAQGFRFLLPLFPLFIFYLLEGVSWLISHLRTGGTVRRWAWIAVLLAMVTGYGLSYRHRVSLNTINEAEGLPAFNELCAYIRENVPPDSRVLFSRARLLSLLTDRASVTSDRTHDFARMWTVLERERVRYICFARVLPDDQEDLAPLLSLQTNKLKPVFNNGDFTLYEVLRY